MKHTLKKPTLNTLLNFTAVVLLGLIAILLGYITKQSSKDAALLGTTLDPLLIVNVALADVAPTDYSESGCCESSSSCGS